MTEMELPEALKGAWEHALFVTYGADLPFFERVLTRQLPVSCRNRIVIADQRQLLESLMHLAQGAFVRTLNQHYVADGAHSQRAMHAKLILLAAETEGRLFVGSGNLGYQGYASGGELFTRYDYSTDEPGDIAAFVAARTFVERLAKERVRGEVTRRRIEHLLETAPWLLQRPAGSSPIRHNLDESLLEQLATEIASAEVDELIVMAPFYDAGAVALTEINQRLNPRLLRILVQPGRTSVDPAALERAAAAGSGSFEIVPINRPNGSYIHAKLIVAKLRDGAISLQGSPNISQVALTLAGKSANVEIANLLRGARGDFDHLLADLELGKPTTSSAGLSLALLPSDPSPARLTGWHLIAAELEGQQLRLYYSGEPPDLRDPHLLIGEAAFPLNDITEAPDPLCIDLGREAVELLAGTFAVSLQWYDGQVEQRSNVVFPFNLASLERILDATGSDRLPLVGSLDGLDDEELEHLLQELADALVVDDQSLWRLAKREPPPRASDEDVWIDYADIDYEALKSHPKLRQYLTRHQHSEGTTSRLQLILSSITASFRSNAPGVLPPLTPQLPDVENDPAETEEEAEEEKERRDHRRQTLEAHLRTIFQNFIRRYFRGATAPQFEQRVGHEVITQNFLIFSFLLLRLFRKPWMPPRFLIESLLTIWAHYLGTEEGYGFLSRLDEDERGNTRAWLHEHGASALLLASVYQSAKDARVEELEDLSIRLRDVWRSILAAPPVQIDAEAIERALTIIDPEIGHRARIETALRHELWQLADLETPGTFLNSIGAAEGSWFEVVQVMRPSLGRTEAVTCLFISVDPATFTESAALELLSRWTRFEKRDVYRIHVIGARVVCFFDATAGAGTYWAGEGHEATDFIQVPDVTRAWDAQLIRLLGPRPLLQRDSVRDMSYG